MKRFKTKTGVTHEGTFYMEFGPKAFAECGKEFHRGQAGITDLEVDCPKCLDRRRMKVARQYFVVTITSVRLNSSSSSVGRKAQCTCGSSLHACDTSLGKVSLDKEARGWADEHLLHHAGELEALQAEHGHLPMICDDGCSVMEASGDGSGPLLSCTDSDCGWIMESHEFSMEQWNVNYVWNNRD